MEKNLDVLKVHDKKLDVLKVLEKNLEALKVEKTTAMVWEEDI
ncbi:hypothetical protein Tco_0947778, partial [Tanacetum coccineum]